MAMRLKKAQIILFVLCGILTLLFFIGSLCIYVKSYQDPRWRVFDYNSRQATEGDIYNVAEVPVVQSVELVGKRKLRFTFAPPFKTEAWKIISAEDRRLVSRDVYPEIQFPDTPLTETFILIPEEVTLIKEIVMNISFYPGEKYHEQGLSWPDNYYTPYSSVPFSLKEPYSLDEWAGLPENDPDVIEARRIMDRSVSMHAPVVQRSEQVFTFVMDKIDAAGGTPSDELQNASPIKTYEMLSTGTGKGWCENRALVYYLFANAAGIKTRLVDIAGKFGPLKLTGHYFCESWDPIQAKWFFVDPMSRAAHVTDSSGKLLHTLEIKKLFDLDKFTDSSRSYAACDSVLTYEPSSQSLISKPIDGFYAGNKGYFTGDIVMAYKFGYPRNSTYSKLEHFLKYPTLLYAPFALPRLYLVKYACLYGFFVCLVLTAVFGVSSFMGKRRESSGY